MANTLVAPVQLNEFPGAPFSQDIVDVAAAAVRRESGWHIAPVQTETLTIDSAGGYYLVLPTLRLVDVTEVRDISNDTPVVLTGWRKTTKGILIRDTLPWPCGIEAIEVDVQHGYASTPPDLLPVIADAARLAKSDARVSQESLGSWSRTLRSSIDGTDQAAVLNHYSVRKGFA